MTLLADLTWTDVRDRAAAGALLAVPIGATEQHGPHLPLSTDTDIAVALCARLARRRADVLVAPPVAYGSSGEHAGFPGTLSIGLEVTELLLLELGRSASDTFAHLLFVSAHGGNAAPVARAAARLRAETRDVHVFSPRWSGDPHAGRVETALQLALRPAAVHADRAVPGNTSPLPDLMADLRAGGVRAVSESGILGDPTGATATEGRALLDTLTTALLREVTTWRETSAA
ncbi:mycofactocin biosynthesis peptidyl-dipeptidase MftE [Nocardia sp. alder85J]|uniref:mycofactocin biosynthesis peptidyl-dipeptidase MftE n=1 Tax=Nocardia sp. alder85J TaxID=2862949 RepID=UPI001CD246BF|nr:mycofactocin biosynthesis peptidyl-dipeptidase MftE [Nocardia sp. alder85J]MCX4090828.1 mycofactocin biosynthesis peptidyl-dipeptidase MftE [Nocardia sp. alder85J]